MSKLPLLTTYQADAFHAERQRKKEEAQQKELAQKQQLQKEADRLHQLKLPQLIDEYIEYLAGVQREQQLPIRVNSPPDTAENTINEMLKPYGLYLAARDTDHMHDPVRYTLTRLAK